MSAPAIVRADVDAGGPDPHPRPGDPKTRPCLVVSPDELNAHLGTFVVPDQLCTVARERLVKRLGALPVITLLEVLSVLQAMFAVQGRSLSQLRPRLWRQPKRAPSRHQSGPGQR